MEYGFINNIHPLWNHVKIPYGIQIYVSGSKDSGHPLASGGLVVSNEITIGLS
jgi:hypothetical protein